MFIDLSTHENEIENNRALHVMVYVSYITSDLFYYNLIVMFIWSIDSFDPQK